MKKKIIGVLLILLVAIMCCGCGPKTKQKTISNNTNSSYEQKYSDYINDLSLTLYVTKYGDRYHRPGCGYVKQIYKKLTVRQAKNKGYTPCYLCCH